jgi:four helix bundle protein
LGTELQNLEVYQLARKISKLAWGIYVNFSWQEKKVVGDQFITAVDSVGANIAEGWGRLHFLDRNRFNYNARGSLVESQHWLELMIERNIISKESGEVLRIEMRQLRTKLNNFILSIKNKAKK